MSILRALMGIQKVETPIQEDISGDLAKRYRKPRKRDSSRQRFHAPHQWHPVLYMRDGRVVGEYWERDKKR